MVEKTKSSTAETFWKSIEIIAVSCFLASLTVMFIQVASRYALRISVPWTDETSRFFFVGAVFLGAAICQRCGTQIRITVFLDILPTSIRRRFELASNCFTALVTIAVFIGAVEMAQSTANLQAAALPITYAWLYAVQGLGLFLILCVVVRDIWLGFTTTSEPRPMP